ncbi:ArnT family glycosyltransferase [Butyrivibrio sp. YAB3001]|uniref:ArnT family glycosyltransferase n=1 Tax=Butyrivibrio sp. YAB3001 TaxID=1520812 RepID=UPI0008F647EE|nr:glycosyltransferase family 39 protein [Butyrivibrio sp. YAB3001]SFC74793.1 Dolichyl-phosphate-mannose-protein mannosyltransferase [Butyrivibrio sp. YAB3001]
MNSKAKRYTSNIIDIVTLIISMIIGAILRIVGYDWGGYGIHQPDEIWMVQPAVEMAAAKKFTYNTFYYPAQSFAKINAFIILVHRKLTGTSISLDHADQYYVCRITTAIAGVLTIAIVFLIGNYLFKHWGTICALLLAISPQMIIISKQVTGDINVCLCGALTMFLALKYSEAQKKIYMFLMAFVAAFATMEKYHGGATTILIALFILLYSKSFKDFFIRGLETISAYLISIILISPNIIKEGPLVLVNNFFDIAKYKNIDQKPPYINNLIDYVQCGYMHIGGILYILAMLGGIIVIFKLKDKRFLVIILGVIKVAILCLLNRAFLRWGLELYLMEIMLIALFFAYIFSKRSTVFSFISAAFGLIIATELLLASVFVTECARRTEQDVCSVQAKYCNENGITTDNAGSTFYTAFELGGFVHNEEHAVWWELDDALTVRDGETYKIMDVDYLICASRAFWNGQMERYNLKDLCIYKATVDYPDIFFLPTNGIIHSYNDLFLCKNYLEGINKLRNGAITGAYDIYIFDLRNVKYINQ